MAEENLKNDQQPQGEQKPSKGLGRRDLLLQATVLSGAAALATSATKQSAQAQTQNYTQAISGTSRTGKRPNIVMLMTDDTGWGDFGCSSGGGASLGHPTPNLDKMAAEGAVFTSWYGQASCTAGRASFITGRIPIRSALSIVVYNLTMDPCEKYDMTFNGAAPARVLTTSPGKYAGQDNGWVLSLIEPVLIAFDKSIIKYPNVPRYVGGASNDLVPDLQHPNNPVPLLHNKLPPSGAGGNTD